MTPEDSPQPSEDYMGPVYKRLTPEESEERMRKVVARTEEFNRVHGEIMRLQAELGFVPRPEGAPPPEDAEFRAEWAARTCDERLDWMRELLQSHEEQREEILATDGEEEYLQMKDLMARHEELARLECEGQEMLLQMAADQAEVTARVTIHSAEMMKRVENLPEEKWQEMTPAQRSDLMNMLNEWNGGRKAEMLASLPIEMRRKYE